jgi:hypothetical protein
VAGVSPAPLSPAAALGWLGSLSIDVRAAVVLDAAGAVLAGDRELGRRAGAALAAAPGAPGVDRGDLLAVRSARHAVAASLGPHALRRVARADLAAAAEALERA